MADGAASVQTGAVNISGRPWNSLEQRANQLQSGVGSMATQLAAGTKQLYREELEHYLQEHRALTQDLEH